MGYVYEDITAEQRAQIGMIAAMGRGAYGMVTKLAQELGTSRKFVYGLADKVRRAVVEAVQPMEPGPKAVSLSLEVDRRLLDRAIVTLAIEGRMAQRPIAECLGELYRVRPSLGYINGVLAEASRVAEQFNRERVFDLSLVQAQADELFACGQPHLVVVEHSSMLILALERPERCDEDAWRNSFEGMMQRGVGLARLASDGGKALGAAIAKLAGVEHQLDRWHGHRHIGRVLMRLEQAAYAAMGREEGLAKKLQRGMDRAHLMGGYVHDRYQEARKETRAAIDRYEAMQLLQLWVREALEAIDPKTGRLRSRAECEAELKAATELMRELGVAQVKKLADYLDKAALGLLAYVDRLAPPMALLSQELGEERVRLLCREWLLGRRLAKAKGDEKTVRQEEAYLRARLLALLECGQQYPEAQEKVAATLEGVMKGSSLVECVNSWLRPYADLMKGLGDRFLPLFVLYRNAHVFERGKRAGKSPFQLAGVETPEGDWLDWLGLGSDKPPLQLHTVRSLPKAA
jgi:hypothetical protein